MCSNKRRACSVRMPPPDRTRARSRGNSATSKSIFSVQIAPRCYPCVAQGRPGKHWERLPRSAVSRVRRQSRVSMDGRVEIRRVNVVRPRHAGLSTHFADGESGRPICSPDGLFNVPVCGTFPLLGRFLAQVFCGVGANEGVSGILSASFDGLMTGTCPAPVASATVTDLAGTSPWPFWLA